MISARDIALARRAKRHGARWALRIIIEARRAGLPVSLGFAVIEQETVFRNVFGHDPTIYIGAGIVTRAKHLAYRARRRASGNRLMQGEGPPQLTWWETQDLADRLGGCWRPAITIRVALQTLGARIHEYGYALGVARYNGGGPDAELYSRQVRGRARHWHARLT